MPTDEFWPAVLKAARPDLLEFACTHAPLEVVADLATRIDAPYHSGLTPTAINNATSRILADPQFAATHLQALYGLFDHALRSSLDLPELVDALIAYHWTVEKPYSLIRRPTNPFTPARNQTFTETFPKSTERIFAYIDQTITSYEGRAGDLHQVCPVYFHAVAHFTPHLTADQVERVVALLEAANLDAFIYEDFAAVKSAIRTLALSAPNPSPHLAKRLLCLVAYSEHFDSLGAARISALVERTGCYTVSPRNQLAYPDHELVELLSQARCRTTDKPLYDSFSFAHGDYSYCSYDSYLLQPDSLTWVAGSPFVDLPSLAEALAAGHTRSVTIHQQVFEWFVEDGTPVETLTSILDPAVALNRDPHPDWSPLFIRRAFDAAPRDTYYGLRHRLPIHLKANPEAGFDALLEVPVYRLYEVSAADTEVGLFVAGVVEYATRNTSEQDMRNLKMLAERWEGSLADLFAVFELPPVDFADPSLVDTIWEGSRE